MILSSHWKNLGSHLYFDWTSLYHQLTDQGCSKKHILLAPNIEYEITSYYINYKVHIKTYNIKHKDYY